MHMDLGNLHVKRRIIVVGAGIAGLTCAHELSRTAEARRKFSVRVFEMGHKVGGRLASAHNPQRWGRNEEHGLHVWFGWYDNTFRLADEVWRDWKRPADCPWKTIWDGLRPIWISEHGLGNGPTLTIRRAHHPRNRDVPGHASARSSLGRLSTWLDLPRALTRTWSALTRQTEHDNAAPRGPLARTLWPHPDALSLERLLRRLRPSRTQARPHTRNRTAPLLHRLLHRAHGPVRAASRAAAGEGNERVELARVLDLALAVARILSSPRHGIYLDGDLDRVSSWELRALLREHGASEDALANSRLLECLYDIPFAFEGGDRTRPVLEASTALRFTYRLFADYKHALAFLLKAGAGETLIAPLLDLIRERGVELEPFHRLTRIELDPTERFVERLIFTRAARTRCRYEPLVTEGGFRRFRAAPDWSQLEDGDALRERGVEFYSRFADQGETEEVVLQRGVDFDDVVLGLPLGSIVPNADGHSPVSAWLDAKPHARACLDRLHLVPTVAAQLWLDESVDTLGCRDRAVATWGDAYSVACDMSEVIDHEAWGPNGPRSSLYLCGAWPMRTPSRPSSDPSALHDDKRDACALLEEQLTDLGPSLFRQPPTLHTPKGCATRWDAQYVRANVEPWDLADLALPGADRVRLEANESGLDNLALAGSWVRTPVNTTSVEAAVCSGLAAARALGASCRVILSEDLLRTPPTNVLLPGIPHEHARESHDPRAPVASDPVGRHEDAAPYGRAVARTGLGPSVVARGRRRRRARRVSADRTLGSTA